MTAKAILYAWEIGLGVGVIAASAIVTVATVAAWGLMGAWVIMWVLERMRR